MRFFRHLIFTGLIIISKIDAAYSVRDIGILTTAKSLSFSINESGTIAGMFFDSDRENSTDFIWDSANGLQIISTEGNGTIPRINNKGIVVGGIKDADGASQLYLYDNEKGVQKIGKPEGWEKFILLAFNDKNQFLLFSPNFHGFCKWEKGQFHQGFAFAEDLIFLDAFLALNNHGNIVTMKEIKSLTITSANRRWFSRDTVITPNGALIDYDLLSININDNNDVTGIRLDKSNNLEGFLWSAKEGFLSLGDFCPFRLNNQGEIIGFISENNQRSYEEMPFDAKLGIWKDGKVIDLDDLISVENNFVKDFEKMVFLSAINNAGQIVGIAQVAGKYQVVFLDPIIEKETPFAKAAKEEWEQLSPDQQAWYNVEVDHAIALIQQRQSQ